MERHRPVFGISIIADITGVPVVVPIVFESAYLRVAILAAYGVGIYKAIYEEVGSMVRVAAKVKPNPDNHEVYNKLLPIYEDVYKSLLGVFEKATKIK